MNITIKLLNMMGSELKVESEYGKGSKFYFDLDQKIIDSTPIGDISVRIKRDPAEYKYTSTFVAPDAKLLVVDDNEMNLKVFAGLLKKTKINITTALSGFECLELIKKEKFDIIFLDHMMPDMDGIQTLHEIRKLGDSSKNADTPVYALTANNFADAAAMYENEGFMGYVSKPIVPRKLEELIKTTLDA
jgi:CheY-like chemotaxis protein